MKSKKPEKKPEKQSPKVPGAPRIIIVGEQSMVDEFATVCLKHGYSFQLAYNAPPETRPSFPTFSLKTGTAALRTASVAVELTNTDRVLKQQNLERISKDLAPTAAILSTSVTVSATEQTRWIHGKHRLVGIGYLPGLADAGLLEVAPTVFTPPATLEVVSRFVASIGKAAEIVQDGVGLVFPRVACQMINEAAFAIAEEVAEPKAIDEALMLALRHPRGPVAWAERFGLRQVIAVLEALQREYGVDRYRIAPLLRQMAYAGEWWK